MRNTVYVFFCRTPKRASLWNRFWGWIVRPLHWFPAEHICIGHDGIVVDPLYSGDHLWEFNGFINAANTGRYPLYGYITVTPCPFAINLREFDRIKRQKDRLLPVLFWLTGMMRFRTDDCLGTAIVCLRAAGIHIPVNLRTIGGLYRWLTKEGYVYTKHAAAEQRAGLDNG